MFGEFGGGKTQKAIFQFLPTVYAFPKTILQTFCNRKITKVTQELSLSPKKQYL